MSARTPSRLILRRLPHSTTYAQVRRADAERLRRNTRLYLQL